jgi:long-chain fatty acid transport protein
VEANFEDIQIMVLKLNKSLLAGSVSLALFVPSLTYATNGMNLEGYGPIATGMGGASMAYDNGVAAVMNNPATLGMMNDGESRLDLALGNLRPDISTSNAFGKADSSATSFLMPAVGWAKRDGQLTYGVGMFSQGGMGAEYDACSSVDPTCDPATGEGNVSRSEVGVGRFVVPLVFNVNEKLMVGGSLDYVWGGMDLQMAMPGDATGFGDFIQTSVAGGMFNGAHNAGIAQGTLVDGLANAMAGGAITNVNWVRFDFSDNSDFTGKAKGNGTTGKLGLAYKVNNNLTLGATYHAKTAMSDLTTNGATVSMNIDADFPALGGAPSGTITTGTVPLTGKLTVNDFQFPAQFGLGMAFQQDKWLFVADVKVIKWSDVMDSFNMTFTADTVASNGSFGGAAFDVEMFQNWDNQTVIQLGGAYQLNPETTLRAGINSSSNPIPKETLNHLFPATIENHYTFGLGYAISQVSNIDFSLALAPEVSVKAGSGNTVKHAQTNLQIQYSYKF